MPKRHRIKQTLPLEQRLAERAKQLRGDAKQRPPGLEREQLMRKARQAEAAMHITEWLAASVDRSNEDSLKVEASNLLQRRARRLPIGSERNQLRKLSRDLLRLHDAGLRAKVVVRLPTIH